MADFTQTATIRTTVRKLATSQGSMTTFDTFIGDILADNPWGCTTNEQSGETIHGV